MTAPLSAGSMYYRSVSGGLVYGRTYLVSVPRSGSGSSLGLSVTDNSNGDHVGLVHDTSVGDSEAVPELTAFVDSSGCLIRQ